MKQIPANIYKRELIFIVLTMLLVSLVGPAMEYASLSDYLVNALFFWFLLHVGQFVEASTHNCADKHHIIEKL